jgi:hypothetical protein
VSHTGGGALCRFRRQPSRLLFGPVHGDLLDSDELDEMILMPSIVVACGLVLTALLPLGYETIT